MDQMKEMFHQEKSVMGTFFFGVFPALVPPADHVALPVQSV
jgi:hypothetical protein